MPTTPRVGIDGALMQGDGVAVREVPALVAAREVEELLTAE